MEETEKRLDVLEGKLDRLLNSMEKVSLQLGRMEASLAQGGERSIKLGGVIPEAEMPPRADAKSYLAAMTPKQIAVSLLVAEGNKNEDIAKLLGITLANVKTHVYLAMKRLEVSKRGELTKQIQAFIELFSPKEFEEVTGFSPDWGRTFDGDPQDPALVSCGWNI